jgi:hypothetical protein
MSDRPIAVNGKRSQAWGTLRACPACGQCLCFGCHPAGPCVDDAPHAESFAGSHGTAGAAGLRTCLAAVAGEQLR